VRLSGPQSIPIAESIFQTSGGLNNRPSHSVVFGCLVAPEGTVDKGLATLFRAPHSYTGDDVVEFSCHGSPAILARVVGLCVLHGARLAQPGEFTRRAFENGRLDLAQAESVATLISSQSERARRSALKILDGEFSNHLRDVRTHLLDIRAHVEATLDFSQEEVPPVDHAPTLFSLRQVEERIVALIQTHSTRALQDRQGFRLSFVGRPNVGKSSLFNALLGHPRAIVAPEAATTRDTLEETVQFSVQVEGEQTIDFAAILVDTAGIRQGGGQIEQMGQRRTQREIERSDVVLFVVDTSEPIQADDHLVARSLPSDRTIVLANKSDLPMRTSALEVSQKLFPAASKVIPTSATTKEGLDRLVQNLDQFWTTRQDASEGVLSTGGRHIEALKRAQVSVAQASESLATGQFEECVALDLRQACDALGEITGETASEEVLDRIFSRFCIGK